MRKLFLFAGFFSLAILAIGMMNTMPSTHVAAFHPAPASVVRLGQLDCQQYASQEECDLWSGSACSAAAMAEAMNVYGHSYRITDVLKIESAFRNPSVITPDEGLTYNGGLDRTLHAFGFQATLLKNPTVDQVVAAAVVAPVIVNFPPGRWVGGHFLLVTGGDAKVVRLADSSRLNMQSMSIAQFLYYWNGFAAQVTPLQGGH
jgi:ABC-type bacteriocin/lantibiotic exporter with double-glycine peptidase domain